MVSPVADQGAPPWRDLIGQTPTPDELAKALWRIADWKPATAPM